MANVNFAIRARDEGSSQVDQVAKEVDRLEGKLADLGKQGKDTGRELDGLERETKATGRELDGLGREAKKTGRELDGLERETKEATGGLGRMKAGIGVAALAAIGLASAVGAAASQTQEFHRINTLFAAATNRSRQSLEALTRTFKVYSIEQDTVIDAAKTLQDRIGDALADPNVEAGQIFKQMGLDIENDNVQLEDFLLKLDQFDRRSQVFIAETVLGGEATELLETIKDPAFQKTFQANLSVALDDKASDDILEGGRETAKAAATMGRVWDSALAGMAGIFNDFLAAWGRSDTISLDPQGLMAFAGFEDQGPLLADAFLSQGPTAPTAPKKRILDLTTGTDEEEVAGETARTLKAYQQRVLDRSMEADTRQLGAVGPNLSLLSQVEDVSMPEGDIEARAAELFEETLPQMNTTLLDLYTLQSEYFPSIANNILGLAGSWSGALSSGGTFLSILGAGIATVGILGKLLVSSEERPVVNPEGLPDDPFRLRGTGGFDKAGATAPIGLGLDLAALDLETILDLLGDEGLSGRYEELKNIAVDAWEGIKLQTDDNAERVRLFDEFMRNDFVNAWTTFGDEVAAAWEAQRTELGLSAEEMEAVDGFVLERLVPSFSAMAESGVEAWSRIYDAEGTAEEGLLAIDLFLTESLPNTIANFEGITLLALSRMREENGLLELALVKLAVAFEGAGGRATAALGKANAAVVRLGASLAAIPRSITTVHTTVQRTVIEYDYAAANRRAAQGAADLGIGGRTPSEQADLDRRNARSLLGSSDLGIGGRTPSEQADLDRRNARSLLGSSDPVLSGPALRSGFQEGGRFLVDQPSLFLAGEGGGREVVTVTPENATPADAGGSLTVNVHISAMDGESVRRTLEGEGRKAVEEIVRDARERGVYLG